jgi:hypothetical protein
MTRTVSIQEPGKAARERIVSCEGENQLAAAICRLSLCTVPVPSPVSFAVSGTFRQLPACRAEAFFGDTAGQ